MDKKKDAEEAAAKKVLEDSDEAKKELLPQTVGDLVQLRSIELKIKHGEFITVIGDVGSGKSSLLNAMILDMLYMSPDKL